MLDEAQVREDPASADAALGDRRMRIVHYYPRALSGDGGCTASVRGWASAEVHAGVDVVVACDPGSRPIESGVRIAELTHRGWKGFRGPVGLPDTLRGADLLIVHSGWVFHNVVAARAANRAGVPYVVTPHGAYNPNVFERRKAAKALWWRLFERRVLLGARAVHVFFDEEARFITAAGYRGPVIVAPNGVTLPSFDERDRRDRFVLWMGRLDVETKGIDLVLHAYAQLPVASRVPLRLHGPDWRGGRERIRRMIEALGLAGVVTLGPPVYGEEKWELLRRCGLFLFTPRWDSSSMMALEAAGAEAPIVATSSTFVGHQLARAGGAILVDPTADSIAAGISQGLGAGRGASIGRRAGTIVRERFSWPAVARLLLDQVEPLR